MVSSIVTVVPRWSTSNAKSSLLFERLKSITEEPTMQSKCENVLKYTIGLLLERSCSNISFNNVSS